MKPRRWLAVCFTFVSGLAWAQSSLEANLFSNGGFNAAGWPPSSYNFDVLLQGWTWQGYLGWTYRPDECLDGGGELGFGGGPGSVAQSVNTTVGQMYQLTLTAKSDGYLGGGYLQPTWGSTALPLAYAPISSQWTEITYDVQAIAPTTLFMLSLADDGPVWVDSISLVPISEPRSFNFLFAAAIGILACVRWHAGPIFSPITA